MCWKKWSEVSKPKKLGGLNFRDFRSFNVALLAKTGWRLLVNPEDFWAKFFKALYFPHSSFLEAKPGSNPSWVWRSILKGRDLLSSGVCLKIVNGLKARIWEDPWIPSISSFKISSPKPIHVGSPLVSELIDSASSSWKLDFLNGYFSVGEASAILKIPLGSMVEEDIWVWKCSKDGVYSVKSGYFQMKSLSSLLNSNASSSSFNPSPLVWKLIWGIDVPPKFKIFWWRVCHNALATKENLWRRKCGSSPWCSKCGLEIETIEHILFRCPYASKIWSLFEWWKDKNLPSIVSSLEWFDSFIMGVKDKVALKSKFKELLAVCWWIWKFRNALTFEGSTFSVFRMYGNIINLVSDWSLPSKVESSSSRAKDSELRSVLKSVAPVFMCDGAFSADKSIAASAWVQVQSGSKVIDRAASRCPAVSAAWAEANAVLLACKAAVAMGFEDAIICSDAKEVISLCSEDNAPPWEYSSILFQIRSLVLSCNFKFLFCPRSLNSVAHWVVVEAMRGSLPVNWVAVLPNGLVRALNVLASSL